MGGIGNAKSHVNQCLGAMAGLVKIRFARLIQPTQEAFHFKPLAGFPNRADLFVVDGRYDCTIKPVFDALQNQEHRIRFKADTKLVLVIEWTAKKADIKV